MSTLSTIFGTSELETFGLVKILRMREVYNVDGFGPTSRQLERIPCPLYRLCLPNLRVNDLVRGSLATIRTYESATRPSLWLCASDNALQELSPSGRETLSGTHLPLRQDGWLRDLISTSPQLSTIERARPLGDESGPEIPCLRMNKNEECTGGTSVTATWLPEQEPSITTLRLLLDLHAASENEPAEPTVRQSY